MATSVRNLPDLARTAPDAARSARPITTWREDLLAMAAAFWPITALFFDARNHNNQTGQESFFSVAHIVLYAGLTVVALVLAGIVYRHQVESGADPRKLQIDLKAIPVGYGVSIIGLLILGAAGPADLLWHSIYGFEVGIDAIVSPPHLALFFGGLLAASTGIRSMWAKKDLELDLRGYAPVLLSSILFIGMAAFTTMYMSAFMANVAITSDFVADAARFDDVQADQSIGLVPGLVGYGDGLWPYHFYSVGHALASMIITTFVLLGPSLMLMRRWRVPAGAFTLTMLGFGLLMNIMTEFREAPLLISLVATGIALDVLAQRLPTGADRRLTLGSIRLAGPLAAAALWCTYFAVVAIDQGIGWETTTWTGALLLLIGAGFAVSFLVAPPAYGPRLVEGHDQ